MQEPSFTAVRLAPVDSTMVTLSWTVCIVWLLVRLLQYPRRCDERGMELKANMVVGRIIK